MISRQAQPSKLTRLPNPLPISNKHDGRGTKQRRNSRENRRRNIKPEFDVHRSRKWHDDCASGRARENQSRESRRRVDRVAVREVPGQGVDILVQSVAHEELPDNGYYPVHAG